MRNAVNSAVDLVAAIMRSRLGYVFAPSESEVGIARSNPDMFEILSGRIYLFNSPKPAMFR